MELEQLKNLWPKEMGTAQKQDEYLLSLLSKRSNSPIAKMKRNLRWELIAMIVLYTGGIMYYFYAFEGRMVEIAWLMLALGLIYLVYYYYKNRLLNKMQCVACQVKSHLELQLGTLEKYVRFYLMAGNILFPLALLAVGYVGMILYPERIHSLNTIDTPYVQQFAIKYLLMTAALSVGVYFLNKWYVNRLYGRHIAKLKEMLRDME
jgi:hypothetical protein